MRSDTLQVSASDARPDMSRVLVQAVRCDWRAAYEFAAEPARMPEWATGLAKGKVSPDAEKPNEWRVDSPTGHARMRVVPRNNFGVLDHWVTPEGLGEVYVPFRVISAGEGRCEFQLTLLRQPTMDDAAFERDSEWIRRDLDSLRRLLERS